jgi:hypothetical protein
LRWDVLVLDEEMIVVRMAVVIEGTFLFLDYGYFAATQLEHQI